MSVDTALQVQVTDSCLNLCTWTLLCECRLWTTVWTYVCRHCSASVGYGQLFGPMSVDFGRTLGCFRIPMSAFRLPAPWGLANSFTPHTLHHVIKWTSSAQILPTLWVWVMEWLCWLLCWGGTDCSAVTSTAAALSCRTARPPTSAGSAQACNITMATVTTTA